MSDLFSFTGVTGAAAAHMAGSIANPVDPSTLAGTPSEGLLGVTVDPADIRCWGAIPGPGNERSWDRMQPGDIALIYAGNRSSPAGARS